VSRVDYKALCGKAARAADFKIPDPLVAPRRKQAAAWGAKWSAERCGARRVPRAIFFKQTTATGPVTGATAVGESEILVADGLSLADTAGIAAHETCHALGDEDEGSAELMQRAAKSAWLAERFQRREQLAEDFWALLLRINAGNAEEWQGLKSVARLKAWYGGSLTIAMQELRLADEELEMLEHLPANPVGHLTLRGSKPPQPVTSWNRGPR